jgi:hypothetical protein
MQSKPTGIQNIMRLLKLNRKIEKAYIEQKPLSQSYPN